MFQEKQRTQSGAQQEVVFGDNFAFKSWPAAWQDCKTTRYATKVAVKPSHASSGPEPVTRRGLVEQSCHCSHDWNLASLM
jgi:hypothetical protein